MTALPMRRFRLKSTGWRKVTAQIFRAIEKDGKKASQVRTFLEYYLPTTQKLLDFMPSSKLRASRGKSAHGQGKIEDTHGQHCAGL